jgi:hypothetical protein
MAVMASRVRWRLESDPLAQIVDQLCVIRLQPVDGFPRAGAQIHYRQVV